MSPAQIQALESMSEAMQKKYSSLEAARFNKALIEKYKISQDVVDDFIEIRGDYILSLNTEQELIEKLTSIGLGTSADLILNDTKVDLSEEGVVFSGSKQDIYVSQKSLVSPLRTMADDMEKVHGYGAYRGAKEPAAESSASEPVHQSTQEATLAKKPALADAPIYSPHIPTPTPTAATPTDETLPDTRWRPTPKDPT